MFEDFEFYPRTEVDLVEDEINLVLDEYISKFITYKIKTRFLQYQKSFRGHL